MGRSRELRGLQRRRNVDDEKHSPGSRAIPDSRELRRTGCDSHTDNMQAWDTPEHYAELLKLIPYKRIGEPEEIGRVAVWLASDESDYIQGATLFVDGGMTLYPGSETGGWEI